MHVVHGYVVVMVVVVVVVVTFTWGNGERGKKNSLVERFQLQQQRLIVDHIVGDIAAHPVTMLSQGRGIIGGHLVITDVRTVRDTWNKYREKDDPFVSWFVERNRESSEIVSVKICKMQRLIREFHVNFVSHDRKRKISDGARGMVR